MYEINLDFLCKNHKYRVFLKNAVNLYNGFWNSGCALFTNEREFDDFILFLWEIFEDTEGNIKSNILDFDMSIQLFKILKKSKLLKGRAKISYRKERNDLNLILAELKTYSKIKIDSLLIMSYLLNRGYNITADYVREIFNISKVQFRRFKNLNMLANRVLKIKNISNVRSPPTIN